MANPVVAVLLKLKDEASEGLGRFQKGVSGLAVAIGGLVTVAALGKFFKDSVAEGIKAEDSFRRLGTSVKNAGGDFESLKPSIDTVVNSVQKLSNQTDDDLRNSLTKLISTTGDVSGSMKNLGLVADVAAERHIDLDAAAVLVGKTMNGNLTPLTKAYGVEVKSAAEGVALLHTKTDGFAKTATAGFGGALKNLTIQWGELKEAVGLAIIGSDSMAGSTNTLADALITLQQWVADNEEGIGQFAGTLAAAVPAALDFSVTVIGAFKAVGDWIRNALFDAEAFGIGLRGMIGDAISKIDILPDSWQKAGTKMKGQSDVDLAYLRNTQAVENAKRVKNDTETETARTGAAAKGGKDRVVLSKEEAAEQKKTAEKLAKDLEEARIELVVKLLMLEKNWTEDHAKEWVKRQKAMGESLGVQVTTLKDAYERIDAANAKLGEGFQGIAPKVKLTETRIRELRTAAFDLDQALFDLHLSLSDVGNANVGVAEDGKKAKASLEDGGRAAIGMAQALGVLDDKAAAALQNLVSIGQSLGTGNVVGIIGGLSGLLGSIFAGDAERLAMIRRNAAATEKLASVNGELLSLNTPGRKFADISAAVNEAATAGDRPGQKQKALGRALAKRGLTLNDAKDLAESLGIDFSDVGGFQKALGEVEFSSFGDTFTDQLKRIGIGKGIGAIGAGEELGQVLGATGAGGSNAILGALQGLDLSTAGGAGEAVANLRQLFNNIGTLQPGEFGGLTGPEFLESIERLIGLLTDDVVDLGGVLVPGGIATGSLIPEVPVVFNSIAQTGQDQLTTLDSIDTKLSTLIDVTARAGGSGTFTANADVINQTLARQYQLDQLTGGSAERT